MGRVETGHVPSSLSCAEIADAIRALTQADLVRLRRVAQRYAWGRPIEPEDLLQQEAFARALDGRKCPTHIGVVKFLAESMRSIAHGESEKAGHRLKLVSVSKTGPHQQQANSVHDPGLTPEESLMSRQSEAAMRSSIVTLFEDDPQARDIVEGTLEGWSAAELRELTGLDETGYASKRRLIRRRVDKAFSKETRP